MKTPSSHLSPLEMPLVTKDLRLRLQHRAVANALARASALVCAVWLWGCGHPPETEPVLKAHAQVRRAIAQRDAGALYDLSPVELHEQVADLASKLRRAESLANDRFPPAEGRILWGQLALELLDAGQEPRSVFSTLGSFVQFRYGPEVEAGLEAAQIEMNGDRASVHTVGGETFDYIRHGDGEWRALLALQIWQQWPEREQLLANLDQLDANLDRMGEQRHLIRDPRTVEGAFNRLRGALAEQDAALVYTLLDAASRAELDSLAFALPEPAQLEKPSNDEATPQDKAAENPQNWRQGVTRAENGLSLTQQLAFSGEWDSALPRAADAKLGTVERTGPGQARVSTITGQQLQWVREEQDVWRTTALQPWLKAQVISPTSKSP